MTEQVMLLKLKSLETQPVPTSENSITSDQTDLEIKNYRFPPLSQSSRYNTSLYEISTCFFKTLVPIFDN